MVTCARLRCRPSNQRATTVAFHASCRALGGKPYQHHLPVTCAAVREGESRIPEAQRQAWVPEPRRGSWRTRLISQDIIVAEADGRLLGFMSLAERGYIAFAYIRAEARGAGLLLRAPTAHASGFGHVAPLDSSCSRKTHPLGSTHPCRSLPSGSIPAGSIPQVVQAHLRAAQIALLPELCCLRIGA